MAYSKEAKNSLSQFPPLPFAGVFLRVSRKNECAFAMELFSLLNVMQLTVTGFLEGVLCKV